MLTIRKRLPQGRHAIGRSRLLGSPTVKARPGRLPGVHQSTQSRRWGIVIGLSVTSTGWAPRARSGRAGAAPRSRRPFGPHAPRHPAFTADVDAAQPLPQGAACCPARSTYAWKAQGGVKLAYIDPHARGARGMPTFWEPHPYRHCREASQVRCSEAARGRRQELGRVLSYGAAVPVPTDVRFADHQRLLFELKLGDGWVRTTVLPEQNRYAASSLRRICD